MIKTIAIQTDPVEGLDIAGDTTFALGLEAQNRGYSVFTYAPWDLSMNLAAGPADGRDGITASGRMTALRDEQGNHANFGDWERRKLTDFDVVLMRQDPPFDMQYITATHILEHLHPKPLVVNNPAQVRNAPEKLLITYCAELLPPTLITRNPHEITAFRNEHKDIIVKPLFGNGGAGIFHLTESDTNLSSLLEMMLAADRAPLMVQKYLGAVRDGDKRVILIDGEAVAALNRIPKEGEARSNLHVGGKAAPIELDDDDRRIAKALSPILKERDLLFAGIDVIGGYLTEINVTSPTGVREIKNFTGIDTAALIWDAIEKRFR